MKYKTKKEKGEREGGGDEGKGALPWLAAAVAQEIHLPHNVVNVS